MKGNWKKQRFGSWLRKLLTPALKYAAIDHLIAHVGLSQRLADRVVGVSRSAYGHAKKRAENPQGDKYSVVRDW